MDASPATPLQDSRFLLLEALGHGGSGSVYRAFDRTEQRLVALKVPLARGLPGPAHPLSEEFDHWSRLRHRNIVRVYGMGHATSGPLPVGQPYLVLEHVRGRPAHVALRPGHIGGGVAEELAAQLLSALDHVHAAGSVHRDLKPGNVLAVVGRRRGLQIKLTDFGLAARAGVADRFGTFSGSIPYVAPEALVGLPLDGRADLYSLGVLLYQMVTGQMPVSRGGPREILRWHLSGPPADPARVRGGISPRLRRFILRLTARDRDERPASAAGALELLGARGVRAARPPVPPAARGALATLRLALDATRLGAWRVVHLPDSTGVADAWLAELEVWSQVRGIGLYRLEGDVERLVLQLLAARGGAAAELVERFGLGRGLSLDVLGGVPLLGAARPAKAGADGCANAGGIAAFIADCAAADPLVLHLRKAPGLNRAVGLELLRRVDEAAGRGPRGQGGLLVVVEERRGEFGQPC